MNGYVLVILASICLGFTGYFVKILEGVHFTSLVFARVFFGFLFLFLITRFTTSRKIKSRLHDYKDYALLGLSFAVAATLFTLAFTLSSIQEVIIINYLFPFFVFLLAFLFLGEKLSPSKLVSALLAFVALIIMNPFQPTNEHIIGNLVALASSFTTATFIVLLKRDSGEHGLNGMMWAFFFSSLFILPFILYFGFAFEYILTLALFGIITVAMTYGLMHAGMKKNVEADITAIFMLVFVPLVSFILAIVLIGEEFRLQTAIGGALLIVAGIILQVYSTLSKKFGHYMHK